MRNWPVKPVRQARIEIIPMIDVMMFLLVFFVLISTNVLPALGLKVALPHATQTEKLVERKKVTLTIDSEGKTYLDGSPVEVDQLPDRLKAMTTDAPPIVIIAGDGASHLQNLVDVLDALKVSGIPAASIIAKAK